MDDEKEGDIRVPLAFTVFLLCVMTGGIFLVFYVFVPSLSQPWYPTAALLLIGTPWLFWLLTFIYTCMKPCCFQGGTSTVDHQISRRQSTRNDASASSREPEMPLTHSIEVLEMMTAMWDLEMFEDD
ncbi:hypothetical protein ACS0TY_020270 [Phlomoides rotata]